MSKLATTVKHEFLEMLPPTIFFFVILHIVAIVHALTTRGTGIALPTSAAVTVGALVLGKSVLIADMLPFVNRFPQKPLVWNIGWKTLIYAVVALVVHYLERLFEFWKDTGNLIAANHKLIAELNWPHFWAIQILLVTLIAMYCVLAELARVIGRKKFRAMFFGPVPAEPSTQASMD
jgi:hypothetical protein